MGRPAPPGLEVVKIVEALGCQGTRVERSKGEPPDGSDQQTSTNERRASTTATGLPSWELADIA